MTYQRKLLYSIHSLRYVSIVIEQMLSSEEEKYLAL